MKKTFALILALVMVFSLLAACGNGDTPSDTSPPPAGGDTPVANPVIGTIDENIDHQSRPKYTIAYTHYDNSILQQQMYEAYVTLQDKYNFDLIRMSGNTDDETYITNLETLIDRGDIDGFIIETTNSVQNAVLDMMEKSGLPYVNQFTEYFDGQGRVVTPTVGLPQHEVGYVAMKYLIDNYKQFWGDVDPSTFGVIGVDFSVSPALYWRTQGLLDAFRDAFPDNPNVFEADSFAMGQSYWFALEGGYEPTVQIVSANPQVTHWFMGGTVESYSMGAARAAEEMGRDSTMLVTTVGHPLIEAEWDNGYDGCKKAVVAISNYAYATPIILGLIAQIDGRATVDTLWPQFRGSDDLASVWEATYAVITKDNYKAFLDEMNTLYGP